MGKHPKKLEYKPNPRVALMVNRALGRQVCKVEQFERREIKFVPTPKKKKMVPAYTLLISPPKKEKKITKCEEAFDKLLKDEQIKTYGRTDHRHQVKPSLCEDNQLGSVFKKRKKLFQDDDDDDDLAGCYLTPGRPFTSLADLWRRSPVENFREAPSPPLYEATSPVRRSILSPVSQVQRPILSPVSQVQRKILSPVSPVQRSILSPVSPVQRKISKCDDNEFGCVTKKRKRLFQDDDDDLHPLALQPVFFNVQSQVAQGQGNNNIGMSGRPETEIQTNPRVKKKFAICHEEQLRTTVTQKSTVYDLDGTNSDSDDTSNNGQHGTNKPSRKSLNKDLKKNNGRSQAKQSRKPWTEEEEDLLYKGVQKYGERHWSQIAKECGIQRTGLQIFGKWRYLSKSNDRMLKIKSRVDSERSK